MVRKLIGGMTTTTEYNSLWECYTKARSTMNDAYSSLWSKFVELVAG
jgi:hypothetical protein